MSKIRNGGLNQYGAEPFEQQQFGIAGVEGLISQSLIARLMVKYRIMHCTQTVTTTMR